MQHHDRDAIADGLALIEAKHRGDEEAAQVLLDHGSPREMAEFLAALAENLIGEVAAWNRLRATDVYAVLREWGSGDA